MRAGMLRHVVTLIETGGEPAMTDTGDWTAAKTNHGDHRARVEPLSGRDLEIARQTQPNADVRVTMRWPGVRVGPGWELTFEGRTLYVRHVQDVDERGRMLVMLCGEDVSDV